MIQKVHVISRKPKCLGIDEHNSLFGRFQVTGMIDMAFSCCRSVEKEQGSYHGKIWQCKIVRGIVIYIYNQLEAMVVHDTSVLFLFCS